MRVSTIALVALALTVSACDRPKTCLYDTRAVRHIDGSFAMQRRYTSGPWDESLIPFASAQEAIDFAKHESCAEKAHRAANQSVLWASQP